MAKKLKTADTAETTQTDTATTTYSSDSVLKYGEHFSTTFGALGVPAGWEVPKALAYVLQNGFNQSMTDAAAFTKEQKADALAKAQATDPSATAEAVNAALALEARQKRFEAILSGTVGFRAGGGGAARMSQIDKVMRDIARDVIKATLAVKKLPTPKAEVMKGWIEQYVAKHAEKVRAEAQARLDAAKADAADLDDILG